VPNRLENATAEGAVDFVQTAPAKHLHATGDRAAYVVAPVEQVELSGHPWAQTDKVAVLHADRLRYGLKSGDMDATGLYQFVFPKSAATNGAPPVAPKS
jgi:lipopolysaccharide export system protein LptA